MTTYRSPKPFHARRAIPTRCGEGVMHQSKLEARRCDELHWLQKGGLVSDLEAHPQPVYRLEVNGELISTYRPDFRYVDEDGAQRVEDTKGMVTAEFEMKRRLMKALHQIDVELVRKTGRRR